jgi:type II secretory pathway pseudopilin PulG
MTKKLTIKPSLIVTFRIVAIVGILLLAAAGVMNHRVGKDKEEKVTQKMLRLMLSEITQDIEEGNVEFAQEKLKILNTKKLRFVNADDISPTLDAIDEISQTIKNTEQGN